MTDHGQKLEAGEGAAPRFAKVTPNELRGLGSPVHVGMCLWLGGWLGGQFYGERCSRGGRLPGRGTRFLPFSPRPLTLCVHLSALFGAAIAPAGCLHRCFAGFLPAGRRTVAIAAIAARTDAYLFSASTAVKEPVGVLGGYVVLMHCASVVCSWTTGQEGLPFLAMSAPHPGESALSRVAVGHERSELALD